MIQKDLQHIWHPCTQMKDHQSYGPIPVRSASGSYITLSNDHKLIDAIASWWCKSLGHGHPRLKRAIETQINQFEHVLLANTTNNTIIALSEKLTQLTDSLNKVFYTGDGASAIEVALKMSIHSRVLTGQKSKNKFVKLKHGYHGDTCGAMSVSDVDIFKTPYHNILFTSYTLEHIPYVTGPEDPLWTDADTYWQHTVKQLDQLSEQLTGIIVEPIVQGAGGMHVYSKHFLQQLSQWARMHDVHLIADEIMTGIGRTGDMLACHHADIEPDFLCLSKGLTSGWMPFSAVLTSDKIYELFYDDYETGKAFLHSHTYCGNALAAAIALETLTIIETENICDYVKKLSPILLQLMQELAAETGRLSNIRHMGAIVAADLATHPNHHRIGFMLSQQAIQFGALLRPIGNTLYWLPPLNVSLDTLVQLKDITKQSIEQIYK